MLLYLIRFKGRKYTVNTTGTNEFTDIFLRKMKWKFERSELANINQSSNKISFNGPIFRFVWNGYNMFNGITSASVELSEKNKVVNISYQLWFTEWLIIALVFSIIPFTIRNMPELRFGVLFFIWGILYGGTYAISAFRVQRFIKKTIIKIENGNWCEFD